MAGEGDAGEAEGGDAVVVALDTSPLTGRLLGGVPKECTAADGGTERKKGGSVGGQIWGSGGERGEKESEEEE